MPLAPLEAEGRVSTMDSPAIQPPVFFLFVCFFCQRTLVIWTLV